MGSIYAALGDLDTTEQLLARTAELNEAIDHPDLESGRGALEKMQAARRSQASDF